MDNATTASSDTSARVQWKWNSSAEPFSQPESAEWKSYSEIDNIIIEKAFKAGETHAFLDNCSIDFKRMLQVSNCNQKSVQRMLCSRDEKRIRPERFISDSIIPNRPFGDQYGFIPYFIKEVVKHLKLTKKQLPSKDDSIVTYVVERAASGITKESIKLGQQCHGQYLAGELLEVKASGMKEVWKCCARLYTLPGFLYEKINETMRLIGSEKHESIWRNDVETLGPFCLLLWDTPFNSHMTKPETKLYRGAQLSNDYIAEFKDCWSKDSKALHSFQAFTSCTRDLEVARMFVGSGVLFVMRVKLAFTVDLKPYSRFSDEEEELLFPGVCFRIDHFAFDEDKKQQLIYLTLQQKHNRSDQHHLRSTTTQLPAYNTIFTYCVNPGGDRRDDNDNLRDDYIDFFDYNHTDRNPRSNRGIDPIRPFLALRYDNNIHRDGDDDDWHE